MNTVYNGIKCSDGVAIGVVYNLTNMDSSVAAGNQEVVGNIDGSFDVLKDRVYGELTAIYDKTLAEHGADAAGVIDVQRMMLKDPDLIGGINAKIDNGLALDLAITTASEEIAAVFEMMGDEYFAARSADVRDLAKRMVNVYHGVSDNFADMPENAVIIANDITPSQTLSMDKSKIAGFVLLDGNQTSHTAILARSLGIPALINSSPEVAELVNGVQVIINATTGKVIANPDPSTLDNAQSGIVELKNAAAKLDALRGKSSTTKSGKTIELCANIGSADDARKAIENDCEGVGLLRSEFLFLGRESSPSEDEQYEVYYEVAQIIGAKTAVEVGVGQVNVTHKRPLVIRTLDIGADKQVDYLDLPKEENPALGYRATRFMLDMPDLFLTQLRAIYRAAKDAKTADLNVALKIMFPMIASVWEVQKCRELCVKAAAQVNTTPDICEIGIMIETPAAAIIADDLAKVSDFFSVGTNDLTQYTLAVDRQGTPALEKYSDTHHPAILKSLQMIAKAANDNGIWAGICGELGGDSSLTKFFIDAGFAELSMSSNKILSVRAVVVEI
ncbi:phosphoenolpyruvate-protein phosphotransferase [Actinomycetota bacterium]|nr:phosphoenolpyruvate-protein phosphotransferase [Actinomycetota bacterium]